MKSVLPPLGTKLLHTVFFFGVGGGNYFRQLLQETLQHIISGGISYCNLTIGAVLPWNERIFRLQLQFFSPCCVRINYWNVTPFLYRIYLFKI